MKSKLKIQYVAPDTLVPYANNARKHPERQIAALVQSIETFGFNQPIGVCGVDVVTGHGRLEAAQRIGMDSVPVVDLSHLTDTQRRAYILADNKVADAGRWDIDVLRFELEQLRDLDPDSLAGFMPGEINKYIGLAGTEQHETPALPTDTTAQYGDVWALGPHRLMCGDSTTDDADVLLDGIQPHLMVTDPPYGVDYDPAWRIRDLGNTGNAIGKVTNDEQADWSGAIRRFTGSVAYVWSPPGDHQLIFAQMLVDAGFGLRNQLIWIKDSLIIGRGHYHYAHEPCWYAVRGKSHWQGSRKESTVWRISHRKSETGHSTQKPVECMQRPIENSSAKGDAVYDPFIGSGTTIVAAEHSGRICYGMEIEPAYVDVAVKRWENLNGQTAERIIAGDEGKRPAKAAK